MNDVHLSRTKSVRILVGVGALSLVIGTAAWLVVAAKRATQTQSGAHISEVAIAPPSGKKSGPAASDQSLAEAVSRGSEVPSNGGLLTLEVRWLSTPMQFAEAGYRAPIAGASGVVEGAHIVLYEKHAVVVGELPDGRYTYHSTSELSFPYMAQVWFDVRSGAAEITESSRKRAQHVSVYYLVPVRILVHVPDETELEVSVNALPSSSVEVSQTYWSKFVASHLVELHENVPRLPLEFTRKFDMRVSAEFARAESSLGTRIPAPNELIELRFLGEAEVSITLVEASPGDFVRAVVQAIGVTEEAMVTAPQEYTRLSVRFSDWDPVGQMDLQEVGWPQDGVLRFRTPVPRADCRPTYTIHAHPRKTSRPNPRAEVAVGTANVVGGSRFCDLKADVISRDGILTVTVQDENGVAQRDLLVRVRPMWSAVGERHFVGPMEEHYTDEDGEVVVHGLPRGAGGGTHVTTDVHLPRDLNPNRSGEYWFKAGDRKLRLTLVVKAAASSPFVIRMVDRSNDTDTGLSARSLPTRYFVVPRVPGATLEVDEGSRVVDATGRIVTSIKSPGEYAALVITPQGEVFLTARHDAGTSTDHELQVESSCSVTVRCLRSDGTALPGCIVFTSAVDPLIAWAIGKCESRGFTRHLVRQTTNASGRAAFPCQVANADPRKWIVFDRDAGLLRASKVGGSVEAGFEIIVDDPLPGGRVTLAVGSEHRQSNSKYHACITPIYSQSEERTSQALLGFGDVVVLDRDSVQMAHLPPGSYLITVVVEHDGMFAPMGAAWSKVIQVSADEATEVQLPN